MPNTMVSFENFKIHWNVPLEQTKSINYLMQLKHNQICTILNSLEEHLMFFLNIYLKLLVLERFSYFFLF